MSEALALAEEPQVRQLAQDAQGLLELAQAIQVTEATVKDATDLLGWIAKAKKTAEELRQFFVRPLNEQVRRINAFFKERTEPLERADTLVRGKMLAFQQEQVRRKREAEEAARRAAEAEQARRAAEAAAAGLPAPPPPPVPVAVEAPKTVRADLGTATAVHTWTFEIVDESLIPREFLMPNEKAIRAAVRAGVRHIPGVRIYQDVSLQVRTR